MYLVTSHHCLNAKKVYTLAVDGGASMAPLTSAPLMCWLAHCKAATAVSV